MAEGKPLWRIEAEASADTVEAFEAALEPYCGAISWFATDSEPIWHIEGFSATKPDPRALAAALAEAAGNLGTEAPRVFVHSLPPGDWLADNLRMFPPFRAGRYFIHPTHYAGRVPAGSVGLRLNPGAAFGSGEHPTTMGCLLALDGLARRRRFRRPLDMGCGSGILALAMARTWRRRTLAVDNDPIAVAVSGDNARLNRVAGRLRAVLSEGYKAPPIRRGRPFDLIVSNILANPLCLLSADLGRHLSVDGVAVLSGFVAADGVRVLSAHRRHGLRPIRRIDIGGWRTLVMGRKPRARSGH